MYFTVTVICITAINTYLSSRHYCYAYGQAIVEEYRQYLVKKHICDSTEDKVNSGAIF